ncbi:glycosyltransferase [Natronoarchaeum sp. GCM10025703]|uniref:glycosyltransferase n=1 Tax=Natronoarchaeum sp. GCM10025703 TaxID=3252685 RepID=UPI003613BB7F
MERDTATGLPSALNTGVTEAKYDLLARQDADDRSMPPRLERQVAYLNRNPETALVGSGAYLTDSDGSLRSVRHVRIKPSKDQLLDSSPFIHGSVMFRRDPFETVGGYSEQFPTAEDLELWARLAVKYPLRNIDEPLYVLQMNPDSVYATEMYRTKLYGKYGVIRTLTDRCPDDFDDKVEADGISAIEELLTPEELQTLRVTTAQELLRYGDRATSLSHSGAALRTNPFDSMSWGTVGLAVAPTALVTKIIECYRTKLNRDIIKENWRTKIEDQAIPSGGEHTFKRQ